MLTAQEPSAKYLANLHPPLVRHFDLIAQAPGGVTRLRELILTLAVQGKLVPQDPMETPVDVSVISAGINQLIDEGKVPRSRTTADVDQETSFDELPNGWVAVTASNVFVPRSGNSKLIKGKLFSEPAEHLFPGYSASGQDVWLPNFGYEGTAVILSAVGARCGKAFLANGKWSAIANTHIIWPLLDLVLPEYSMLLLNNEDYWIRSGGAQPFVKVTETLQKPVFLPPLDEQSRIVTRVEELMQLCDALEARGQLEAQQHAQLVTTLLGTLTQSETPEALADNWQRLATHFDVLLDRPEAVDALEQTILQLAVRGLLVPKDPTDEPANVLLQKIRTEKDHLIAQGKIKRDKPLPPITDEEKPFELPEGWGFTRFGFVAQNFFTGLDRGRDQQATTRAYAYFKMNNISNDGYVNFENMTRVDASNDEAEKFSLKVSDFLFNTRNSRELVGKTCVIKKLPEHHIIFNNNILVVRFFDEVMPAFVHYFFKSKDGKQLLDAMKSATTNVCAIYQGNLLELVCPIPPYQEQVRIVTRVNELCSLCADLRVRILAGQAVQRNLADALVASD